MKKVVNLIPILLMLVIGAGILGMTVHLVDECIESRTPIGAILIAGIGGALIALIIDVILSIHNQN